MENTSKLTMMGPWCIEAAPFSVRIASWALHEDALLYSSFKDNWLRVHKRCGPKANKNGSQPDKATAYGEMFVL